MTIAWKYVKPLKNPDAIEDICRGRNILIPAKTLDALKNNNGGRPSIKSFDTIRKCDYVFSSLYSFNQDDLNSVLRNLDLFIGLGLFPIGIEAGGNSVCLDLESKRLVLANHENGEKELIALDSNTDLFSELT